MEVPIRIDKFNDDISNTLFDYKYDFQNWNNDLKSTANNKHAYYAISSFIVLKSNKEINSALISE